jgi:hypothetical protein
VQPVGWRRCAVSESFCLVANSGHDFLGQSQ